MRPIIVALCTLSLSYLPESLFAQSLLSKVIAVFNNWDTTYVSPNNYTYTMMAESSVWHENYQLTDSEDKHVMHFTPETSYKIGPYIGIGPLFLGTTFDIDSSTSPKNRTEFSLNIYSSIIGGDIYYRRCNNAFRLNGLTGFSDYLQDYDEISDCFSAEIRGIDAYYVFNHRRFSYPAAYSQSTQQRRSAGSFIAGISYSLHNIVMNGDELPLIIQAELPDNMLGRVEARYRDYALLFGYAYNYVPARNLLLNLTLTPALAYKKSKMESDAGDALNFIRRAPNRLNIDFTARAAFCWNTGKIYAGCSWVYHDFNYRSKGLDISNDFGTARLYFGYNFGRKK